MHDNQLIAALPRTERARLLALCQPVQLGLAQVLCPVGQLTRHVYFPTGSFVSLITQLDARHGLEVGMVGNEGMLGVHLLLGQRREPLQALVQGAGSALRLDVPQLRRELARSPALLPLLLTYVSVLMDQRAVSAACLRFHEIGPRLSRWLLMSQDRAHSSEFPVTQEFLAAMLGVRRVGVTAAAGGLQKRGLIRYHRGRLTVLDRPGLEHASCSCYAQDLLVYARTMRPRMAAARTAPLALPAPVA